MSDYYVTIPVAGHVQVHVGDCDSEEAAIEAAFEKLNDAKTEMNIDDEDCFVGELEYYHELVSGNVCHVPHNRAIASKTNDKPAK